MQNQKIKKILDRYTFKGELTSIKENTQGNINTSYIITFEENGKTRKYILQKINTNVFNQPYLVMKNIELVTTHITKKLQANNDKVHKTLKVIETSDNANMSVIVNDAGEKEYYRIYEFISNCIGYNTLSESANPSKIAYNVGKCLGQFHRMLDDFPCNKIAETIPDFHNTPKRFETFLESVKDNVADRALEVSPYIIEIITRIKDCSVIYEQLGKDIPIRVTHNDTKLNNFLMNMNTNEAIAAIDLDTIMPGSSLFDIGDGIRSVCSLSFEDETDKNKIGLDSELTKKYLEGYLSEMGDYLTDGEYRYLGLSIKVITYELAVRFLTDYLNGDTYFKTKYPNHNKYRFLNQYYLLQDIERKLSEIEEFINNCRKGNLTRTRKK